MGYADDILSPPSMHLIPPPYPPSLQHPPPPAPFPYTVLQASAALAGTTRAQLEFSLAAAEARRQQSEAHVRDVESQAVRRTQELVAGAEVAAADAAARIAAKEEEALRLTEELREAREVAARVGGEAEVGALRTELAGVREDLMSERVARAEEVGGATVVNEEEDEAVFGVAGELFVGCFCLPYIYVYTSMCSICFCAEIRAPPESANVGSTREQTFVFSNSQRSWLFVFWG